MLSHFIHTLFITRVFSINSTTRAIMTLRGSACLKEVGVFALSIGEVGLRVSDISKVGGVGDLTCIL